MTRTSIFLFVLLGCFSASAYAQFGDFRSNAQRSRARRLLSDAPKAATTSSHVPSLSVREDDGTARPLELSRYELSVRILDFLVETTATYTFHNPKNEQVEGVFEFPLPDGVTVDGYALDIGDKMVDGVALPRERATFVFDTIEQRGIDPGLVEQTGRNAFRSRIFPIDGRSSRTIRIRYTDRITSSTYTLPTAFDGKITAYSVDIEAKAVPAAPKIVAGKFPRLVFSGEEKIFRAKTDGYDFEPAENLVLEFPGLDEPETRIVTGSVFSKQKQKDEYFVLRYPMREVRERLEPLRVGREKSLRNPKRIAVYWDASGSRAEADHAGEIELLRKYLAAKQCSVELYFFRDTMEKAGVYEITDYEKLFERIQNAPYDGGTNFLALEIVEHAPDLAILFSDGRNTLGIEGLVTTEEPLEKSLVYHYFHQHPTYIILSEASESNVLTRYFGERRFDLATTDIDEIVTRIGDVSLRIGSHSFSASLFDFQIELDDDWLWISGSPTWNIHDPKREMPVFEIDLCLGGQARAEKLTVPLRFDFGNMWLSEIPKRFYAQRKLAGLLEPGSNKRDAVREHGLKHGLVTPETSLIVLESLEQYIEFLVEPPDSVPEWQKEYRAKKEDWEKYVREAERKWAQTGSLFLKRDWVNLVRWWDHAFDVPEGFRYVPRYDSRNDAFGLPRDRHDAFYTPYSPFRRYDSRVRRFGYGGGGFGGGGFGGGGFGGGGRSGLSSPNENQNVPGEVVVRIDPSSLVRKSPYLQPIREAAKSSPEKAYDAYLEQRKRYARSPLFYWESANLFMELGHDELAFRILRNIFELELGDDVTVRRMLGYLMLQWNRFRMAEVQFDKALEIDANDFASLRGKALSHSLGKGYRPYYDVKTPLDNLIDKQWDVYTKRRNWYFMYDVGFQLVASVERRHNAAKARAYENDDECKKAAIKPLDVDLRVVALASHKNVDIALSVTEPCGERIDRDHALSIHGGALDGGYGMDEYPALSQYMIRRAPKGKYTITLERFDALDKTIEETDDNWVDDFDEFVENQERDEDIVSAETDASKPIREKGVRLAPGVVFVDIFTNYGRPNETRRSLCITLDDEIEVYDVAEVER